jgi:membrane associated rhomboid family serine protease
MSSRNSIGSAQQEAKGLFQELQSHATLLTCVVILLWTIQLANVLLGGSLEGFGIRPGQVAGLQGIFFAPFLHGSWWHLIGNTVPMLILSSLILAKDRGEWIVVTVLAALASGAGTWMFGAPGTLHIGASGVIFGYFGYLVTRAWFDRSIGSILVSLLVILMFGGMIWGIAPIQRGISWEGHLFGLLGGVGTAWLVAKINQKVPSGKL